MMALVDAGVGIAYFAASFVAAAAAVRAVGRLLRPFRRKRVPAHLSCLLC